MNINIQLECRARCAEAQEAAAIAVERIGELGGGDGGSISIPFKLLFDEKETDGYILDVSSAREATIYAKLRRNFIAGLGELMNRLLRAADRTVYGSQAELALELGVWEFVPSVKDRIHYMPGHFGNSFEVCSRHEMKRYLEDLALSGASGYADWFDPNDMPDPYNPHVYHSTSMFLWRRKKEWLTYSQQLGLENVLMICPNVGYVDQMRPEWVGVRNRQLRVQGQVLCPSNPQAREVILANQERLLGDLQQSGIRLSKIVCAPYDDGGCACPKCQPYYPVFLQLVHDVYTVASRFYPELKVSICGWWTSEEESKQLLDFVNGPARDWFDSYLYSATYGVFELPSDLAERTAGMNLGSFVHIGFSNDRRDVYTKTGVHSAARRIQSIFRSFASQRCNGFMTYNESFGDHFNAFAAGLLGWNPGRDVREIAEFYARLMFRLCGSSLHKLVDVLLEMETLDETRAASWAETLRGVERDVKTHEWQHWAFGHILLKAELMRLDSIIEEKERQQPGSASAEMEERLELTEKLWRRLYGFGVLRHILIPDNMLPGWHKAYREKERKKESIRSGVIADDA